MGAQQRQSLAKRTETDKETDKKQEKIPINKTLHQSFALYELTLDSKSKRGEAFALYGIPTSNIIRAKDPQLFQVGVA